MMGPPKENPSPGPASDGANAFKNSEVKSTTTANAPQLVGELPKGVLRKTLQDSMRETLLAQLRISLAELDLTKNHLHLIGCALNNRLLTPHQAMGLAYERDVLDWLFRDREGSQ